jgi:hypothetical protein
MSSARLFLRTCFSFFLVFWVLILSVLGFSAACLAFFVFHLFKCLILKFWLCILWFSGRTVAPSCMVGAGADMRHKCSIFYDFSWVSPLSFLEHILFSCFSAICVLLFPFLLVFAVLSLSLSAYARHMRDLFVLCISCLNKSTCPRYRISTSSPAFFGPSSILLIS